MRICTFNVHCWADARGRGNTERVIALLASLDCDLIALNEVMTRGGQLERAADALGMHYALAPAGFLGNALLSRAPLARVDELEVSTELDREIRSAVLADVTLPTGPLGVCVTHLDPADEDVRLAQLRAVYEALGARGVSEHFIAGDLNALRLTDYPPPVLARVRAHRAASHREEPRGELVAQLDAWGYADALRWSRAPDAEAYARELLEPLPEAAIPTCWAGTRIDYLWLSRALRERVTRVVRCETIATQCSDHHPVLLELEC